MAAAAPIRAVFKIVTFGLSLSVLAGHRKPWAHIEIESALPRREIF
jgi:hypothetical protein